MQCVIPTNEEGRASRAPAENVNQLQAYAKCAGVSSLQLLEQAAEVLCLLTLLPLTATERAGFSALFERRMERAYEGVTP